MTRTSSRWFKASKLHSQESAISVVSSRQLVMMVLEELLSAKTPIHRTYSTNTDDYLELVRSEAEVVHSQVKVIVQPFPRITRALLEDLTRRKKRSSSSLVRNQRNLSLKARKELLWQLKAHRIWDVRRLSPRRSMTWLLRVVLVLTILQWERQLVNCLIKGLRLQFMSITQV